MPLDIMTNLNGLSREESQTMIQNLECEDVDDCSDVVAWSIFELFGNLVKNGEEPLHRWPIRDEYL